MICISYVTLHRAGASWTREYHIHDGVIKWKHFPRYWPFVRGNHRSPVNSPHKGQWRGALMFSLICVWINGWTNNREAGDLRRYHTHYDGTVILWDLDSGKLPNGMGFCYLSKAFGNLYHLILSQKNLTDKNTFFRFEDTFVSYTCDNRCATGFYLRTYFIPHVHDWYS